MELISKLGIDAKILVAQIVNFLILLFILKKFVFGLVLQKLEERRAMIAKATHDAQKSDELLKDIEATRLEMLDKTKKVSLEMIEKAAASAEETKKSILASAHQEAEVMMETTRVILAREKEQMLKEAGEELGKLVVAASEKIIGREFSSEDQKRLSREAMGHFAQK